VLHVLETAAVALAVGAHAGALIAAYRQQQELAAAQAQQQQARGSRRVAQVAAAPVIPPQPAMLGGWPAPSGAWLTLPLVAALVLGRLRAWLTMWAQLPPVEACPDAPWGYTLPAA
jgi:hypothetical protein